MENEQLKLENKRLKQELLKSLRYERKALNELKTINMEIEDIKNSLKKYESRWNRLTANKAAKTLIFIRKSIKGWMK